MHRIFEDPDYDEEGVLIDEDFEEFEDPADFITELERYNPFDTINS
jgi:hypothetical protein